MGCFHFNWNSSGVSFAFFTAVAVVGAAAVGAVVAAVAAVAVSEHQQPLEIICIPVMKLATQVGNEISSKEFLLGLAHDVKISNHLLEIKIDGRILVSRIDVL